MKLKKTIGRLLTFTGLGIACYGIYISDDGTYTGFIMSIIGGIIAGLGAGIWNDATIDEMTPEEYAEYQRRLREGTGRRKKHKFLDEIGNPKYSYLPYNTFHDDD